MSTRILLVDPDVSLREALQLILSAENCEVVWAADADAAGRSIERAPIDVVLVDRGLRGPEGRPLLPLIAQRLRQAPMVLTAPRGTPDLASEALGLGASDVLEKPLHGAEVLLTVRRAREFVRLQRQAKLVRRDVERATSDPPIVASSEAMIELLEVMERAAPFKSSILLYGERGTGKEVLARAIHAQSPRRHLPFVAVNCCAIPKAVLRSELFGHHGDTDPNADPTRRGLFAEANEGTLFLDGIGELPIPIQAEILRVLQDEEIRPVGGSKPRPIDIRLIAATSRDLAPEVAAGRFREDLLHRLNLVRLDVPPLRERPRDIPLLFDHFLVHYSEVLGKPTHGIADDALAQLVRYRWPGNIRELANVVERAVILSTGDRIAIRDLPDDLGLPPQAPDAALPERGFGLKAARKSLEADLIRRALRATSGNRTHAARRLEISHRGLLYKIKEYGIRD